MVNNYFVLFQSLFSEELKPAEELRAQIIRLPQCPPPSPCWAWAVNLNGQAEACFWEANGIYFHWYKRMLMQWTSAESSVTISSDNPGAQVKQLTILKIKQNSLQAVENEKENSGCVYSVGLDRVHAPTLAQGSFQGLFERAWKLPISKGIIGSRKLLISFLSLNIVGWIHCLTYIHTHR